MDSNNNSNISIEEAFSRLLSEPGFHNVDLVGTDGVIVSGNRYALASRSNVLESMLLGDFKESEESVIQIGFEGFVVQAVVEFIHTDSNIVFQAMKAKNDLHCHPTPIDIQNVRSLFRIMEAASYFNLAMLTEKANECLCHAMKIMPSLSFLVVEASNCNSPTTLPEELAELAWVNVISASSRVFTAEATAILSLSVLKEILQCEELAIDEYQLFEFVRQWIETADETQLLVDDGCDCDRKLMEAELMGYIRLELIPPSLLKTKIASSGVFTPEQIYDAFEEQVHIAYEQPETGFQSSRHVLPDWKRSKTTIASGASLNMYYTEQLVIPPVTEGVLQWTVEILKLGKSTPWVGVSYCTSNIIPSYSWLGDRGWAYGASGAAYHAVVKEEDECAGVHPTFGVGSKITFTLTIHDEDNGNGSLDASVDGGPTFRLFSNMRKDSGFNGGRGFVPAVALKENASVELLDVRVLG